MADLGTLALGAYTNNNLTAITGSDPVLEVIASTDDADFVFDTDNSTHQGRARFALADMPADFQTMATLFIRLRYGLSAAASLNTWDSITARVWRGDFLTALTDAVTVVTGPITNTTPANSAVIQFTGVNTTASKTQWDGAVVEIAFNITRSKGGDSVDERIYAAEITGTYTPAATSDDLNPTAVSAAFSVPAPSLTVGTVNIGPSPISAAFSVPAPSADPVSVPLTPTPLTAAFATVAPALDSTIDLEPLPLEAAATVPAQDLALGALDMGPSPLSAAATVPAPSFASPAIANPTPITATGAIIAPSVQPGSVAIAPAPLEAQGSVVAPAVQLGALDIMSDPLTAALSAAIASFSAPSNVGPSPLAAAFAVAAPDLTGVATIGPSPLTAAMTAVAPTLSIGPVDIRPSPLAALWGIFAPSVDDGSGPPPYAASHVRRLLRRLLRR